jgi:PPM family protein phosphatase
VANELHLAIESIAGRRPYQEDSVLAETLGDGRTLVAVADGMGGHAAGEVASALALDTLVEAVIGGMELGDAFRLANEKVHHMASEPGKQGMGTTLVAILVDGREFRIANVGDSRAYLVTGKGIRRLTEDHSFVAEAMKRGQTEAEAMATPWKDALTRSVGTDEEVDVDVFGPLPVEEDSALLVCSDGLYKTLSDDAMRDLFVRSGSAPGAAQSLVTTALDRGSDDNISVAIAEFGEVPRDVAPTTMLLAYDPGAGPEGVPDPESESGGAVAGAVEERSLVAGLPIAAFAAITVVVGVLLAILLLAR